MAALKAGTVADDQAYFVRGTYNSTLDTFVLSSTGNDVLLSTANDAATGEVTLPSLLQLPNTPCSITRRLTSFFG